MSFDMAAQLRRQLQNVASNAPRTIELVTEEIEGLKRQVTDNFLAIGQRLNEAKEMLPHGEWLPWLEGRVQFSERTAQKFMQLAREYESNPKLAADLGSEKAFALLALPKEERERIGEEGAVVDGKTKPAAELTKREVQQIVQEKKAGPARESLEDYMRQREEEDKRFRALLWEFYDSFAPCLRVCDSRQDGIYALKERFKYAATGSMTSGWKGSPKGLGVYGSDRKRIERTWTEAWDLLACLAIRKAAAKKAEPKGQMVLAGWMPGGTTPGEPGPVALVFEMDGPVYKAGWWDGRQYLFKRFGPVIELEPLAWMRLPEFES